MRSRTSINMNTELRLQSGKQGRDFTAAEECEILERVNQLPCFSQLPRHVADSLIQNSLCVEYVPGESIVYQGNNITDMYIILKGHVEVWRKETSASVSASTGTDSAFASLEEENFENTDGGAPGAAAPTDRPAASALASATPAANAPSKRRFGLNLKAALQAVDGVLGRRQNRLGPGAVLGHRVTQLRSDVGQYHESSVTADGPVTALAMTRRMFQDVLEATIGTDLKALAAADRTVKVLSLIHI